MQAIKIVRFSRQEKAAIEEAIRYIHENFARRITTEDLTEVAGISAKKLQAGIRMKTGKTVHEYLLIVRLDKAKDLLTNTDEPIKNIPAKIGLANPSHFGQVFKKFTGQTPLAYRIVHTQ
jgi:AraC-like DNA-binding protein